MFRQKTRQRTDNLDDMESVPTPEGSIEVQILTSVDFERMTEKLRALDKPYRGILQLKYFEEKLIDGVRYFTFEAEGENKGNRLLWERNGIRFYLTSTIALDELFLVAQSISLP